MSGGITLATVASYAAIAGSVAAVGTGIYSAVNAGAQTLSDPGKALLGLDSASQKNQAARSQLLETQGASAGDPLKSGDVSTSGGSTPNGFGNGNVFGN